MGKAILVTPGDTPPCPNIITPNTAGGGSNVAGTASGQQKVPKPGVSGKEGAKDVPSWTKGERPNVGESGKDFAGRLLDGKYGEGNYETGPNSEYNKIKKWGDRSFVDP